MNDIKSNFSTANIDLSSVRFVQDDVATTFADKANLPDSISVIRLDTDGYESSKVKMEVFELPIDFFVLDF